jgi:hypothetical protein
MAESVPPAAERDPHFVGWLPMPRAYARFLAPVAAGLVVVAAITAAVLARSQRSPGDGHWDDGQTMTFVGIAYAEPYAMIRAPGGGPDDPPVTILLVEEGKGGAKDRIRPFDGRPVRVTGTLLARDGWRMLELAAGEDGLRPSDLPEHMLAHLRRSPARPLGRAVLHGEIVDSKCYLGAMKPGGGRTHRGCAVLCLRGGVPPLLVTRDGGDGPSTFLIASEALGPIDGPLIDLAGLPIVVEGTVERLDDISVIRVALHEAHVE